jgi:hypothetical protein
MIKLAIKCNLQKLNGLSFHRLFVPFSKISDSIEFKCDVFPDLDILSDNQLKEYHAVVYQREIDTSGKSLEKIKRYHSLGIKVIFDIDDIWLLPQTHQLYKIYRQYNIPDQTIEILKYVDLVITTTKHLANKIKKYTNKVEVIPNCLDAMDEQWQPNKTKSEHTRFGYIAGIFHKVDVSILQMPILKAYRNNLNAQFVLGGYNDNEDYKYYERVLSANNFDSNKYLRLNSLHVHEYGKAYNYTDVSLIPLQHNLFSECKSEIKLLEAGMHGNPAIVSDVLPYNTFPKETAIFLSNHDVNGWFKVIRELTRNEAMKKEYAESLRIYINKNYNIEKWTQIRKQILKSVLE